MKPLLRDELIALLLDDQQNHPADNWPIEIRDRWVVSPPQVLKRCTIDRVIVLRGEPPITLVHPNYRG
ncbi:MAG: hypothetical protein CVU31_02510 [Betaproteobacteria bacterium HGW-Betaproteobacteria-4]|jgi:hypothetical protein|nr:MAG: hypothetical protein CVU31_02510 [Betaproteobacteria bacterium HGW-Betaproteobacteria-4]